MTIDSARSASGRSGGICPPAGVPSPAGFGAKQYSAGPPVGFSGNSAATWALVALLVPFGAPAALLLGLRGCRVAAANGGEGIARSVVAVIGGGFGAALMLLFLLAAMAS